MKNRPQLSLFLPALLSLFFLLALPDPATAQKKYNRLFLKALTAADQKDYQTAIDIYRGILEKSPDHVDALTQLGICLVSNNQSPDSALTLFYKVLSIIPRSDHVSDFGVELQITMARTYKLAENPDSALAILTRLKDKVTSRSLKKELQQEISEARNFAVLLNNPVPLEIRNLGHELNSVYDDHSPLVSFTGNRILFTSRRPSGDREMYDGQHAEKVYTSDFDGQKWEVPKVLAGLSARNQHESILSVSPDYTQLFLFKNDRGDKNIYSSELTDDKWSEPQKLPAPINSQYDETHACLSADRSTLFFTSDRPGGIGGLDIYMVKKNEFGQWGKPRNAGPNINTDKDEETPMLHPDGRTLYFSSEGHNTIGRFDIFYSQMLADSTWTLPVNMGYPINTPDDDFFFVPSLDKSRAYYASYRFTNSAGRSDLYEVEFDSTYEGSLAVIEGTIRNENNLPPEQIRILVARNSDNRQVGDFRPDPATGKYLLFLESGQSYTIKEATPYAITDSTILNVHPSLAYDTVQQVLMVQDSRMIPPLSPRFRNHIEARKLASIVPAATSQSAEELTDSSKVAPSVTNEIVVWEDSELAAAGNFEETIKEKSREVLPPNRQVETSGLADVAFVAAETADMPEVVHTSAPVFTRRYTVQVLALNRYPEADESYFDTLPDKEQIISFKCTDGFKRYVLHEFDSFTQAKAFRAEIMETGKYQDVFVRNTATLEKLMIKE